MNLNKHLLKCCDILDEQIQQEGKKYPLESHAVSKFHLHLHSIPHWDSQLQPKIKKCSKYKNPASKDEFDIHETMNIPPQNKYKK